MEASALPGDDIIASPEMCYNHTRLIHAPPSEVFPWVLQLGRGRGGWYLPASWERLLPRRARATRKIHPQWQRLAVGDRVPDYGFSKDDYFDVAAVAEPHALVYRSERYGTVFTWAILLREVGERETEVQLRFRGRIQRTGWQRRVLVAGGAWADWATTSPMLDGLKERAERAHRD